VGVRLFTDKLPVARENRILAASDHGDEWYYALHGGEDYELVFTVPADEAEALALQITQQTGTPVASIGEILPEDEGQQLILPDGNNLPLQAHGWDHFKEAA
jgi:thiamine-monophosphate kinase